jgi:hypothetical protein
MNEKTKTKARERAESAFLWWRIIATACGVAAALWVQLIGPGVQEWIREFSGQNEMRRDFNNQFSGMSERLEYIERVLPAPPVVDWIPEASFQVGACTSRRCVYRLVGSRTEFGENCGRPREVEVFLRLSSGRQLRIGYSGDFRPVELGRTPQEFDVPLNLPPLIAEGEYYWRSRAVYPECTGPREPIPRFSPWWPLNVSRG